MALDIIEDMLVEKAVYWPPGPPMPGGEGRLTYGEPSEIACRWEDVQEEYINNLGAAQFSRSKVYTQEVLENGGYLWYGELADVPNPDSPVGNPDAYKIQKVNRLPTLEGDQFLRWVYL